MSDLHRLIYHFGLRVGVLCAAAFLLSSCAQKPIVLENENSGNGNTVAQIDEKSYDEYETTIDTRLAMARDLTMFSEASRACTTTPSYSGAIFTAVCNREVISKGHWWKNGSAGMRSVPITSSG